MKFFIEMNARFVIEMNARFTRSAPSFLLTFEEVTLLIKDNFWKQKPCKCDVINWLMDKSDTKLVRFTPEKVFCDEDDHARVEV